MTPDRIWYGRGAPERLVAALLAPLGWLYCAVSVLRARAYRAGLLTSGAAGVPVIVVGNLSVGGTGKTPFVLWLAKHLRARQLRPGIATRGYGGRQTRPVLIAPDDPAAQVGDEPALLARRAGCPIAVGRDRLAAARLLAARGGCDVVITDDGLQHYRLRRDCEIVIVDGERGHGNRRCLPAGPLREPPSRAGRADLTVVNGGGAGSAMTLIPGAAVSLYDADRRRELRDFRGGPVTAVAGIGNPGRFFRMLRAHGLEPTERPYPDHYPFSEADWAQWPAPVLMTEKDAVKCAAARLPDVWVVPVDAVPDPDVVAALNRILDRLFPENRARGSAGLDPR
jgi:tetraacyldisaccharide 4'-kinase